MPIWPPRRFRRIEIKKRLRTPMPRAYLLMLTAASLSARADPRIPNDARVLVFNGVEDTAVLLGSPDEARRVWTAVSLEAWLVGPCSGVLFYTARHGEISISFERTEWKVEVKLRDEQFHELHAMYEPEPNEIWRIRAVTDTEGDSLGLFVNGALSSSRMIPDLPLYSPELTIGDQHRIEVFNTRFGRHWLRSAGPSAFSGAILAVHLQSGATSNPDAPATWPPKTTTRTIALWRDGAGASATILPDHGPGDHHALIIGAHWKPISELRSPPR